MATCPFCKSEIVVDPTISYTGLTKKQRAVYEAVVSAGPSGYPTEVLLETLFKDLSPITLRSCVYGINAVIRPFRLHGRGGKYYLSP